MKIGILPAALLLNGAGTQARDYRMFGHRFVLVLADHLSRRGIAIVRVVDRGTGASAGDMARATIDDAIGDVRGSADRHGSVARRGRASEPQHRLRGVGSHRHLEDTTE